MKVRLKNRRLGQELSKSRLSQNAWAKRLGLSSGHLANLVNGKRPYPDPNTRAKLLQGLELEFDQLFAIEEPDSGSTLEIQSDRRNWGPPAGEDMDRFVAEETVMTGIFHDFRHAFRTHRRAPGFFLAATLVLFLGIGTATLIFSLVNSVMLRPLLFQDPEQLYLVWEANPDRNWTEVQVSSANFVDLKRQNQVFEDVGAYNDYLTSVTFQSNGIPHRMQAGQVTGDLFSVLGVVPQAGRLFESSETWQGEGAVTILSDATWERFWGRDPAVVGRTIELNGLPCQVIGVMPASFEFPFKDADLWIPTMWPLESMNRVSFRRARGMRAVARLRAGTPLEATQANLDEISQELARLYPDTNQNGSFGITRLQQWVLGDSDQYLWMLLAAVSLLLFIACSNVANMLLALWAGRTGEIAIRVALGAGRGRITRQAVVEALLLCLPAGLIALLVTWSALGYLRTSGPASLPRLSELSLDWHVLLVSFGLVILSSLVFGILPAWRYSARGPSLGLHQQGRGGSDPASHLLSRSLLAAQVALALLLLAGGGLFLRSFWNLNAVDPGFVAKNGVAFGTRLPPNQYTEEGQILGFYDQLLARLGSLPGVDVVSLTSRIPFVRQRYSSDFAAERWEEGRFGVGIRHGEVMPGYFRTMGIPILQGRGFSSGDRSDATLVTVISEGLAEQYFPDSNPLGQRIAFDSSPTPNSQWWEIVGIAGDVRRLDLGSLARAEAYVPYTQDWAPGRSMYVVMRSGRETGELISSARSEVIALDSNLPIFDARSLADIRFESLAERRFFLLVLLVFALASCALSVAGIYGVLSHYLARRRREMGVRTALGATRQDLVAEATRGGMKPVVVGLLAGIVLVALLARTVASLLYEVRPLDPGTLLVSVLLLTLVSLVSCLVPAYRASQVDPLKTLRAD